MCCIHVDPLLIQALITIAFFGGEQMLRFVPPILRILSPNGPRLEAEHDDDCPSGECESAPFC